MDAKTTKAKATAFHKFWKDLQGGLDDYDADNIEVYDNVEAGFDAGFQAALQLMERRIGRWLKKDGE